MNAIQILKDNGFPVRDSDLNYCTDSGIEYYIGRKGSKAAVVTLIEDEDIYFLSKGELRQMSFTAREAGVKEVFLFTNYGIELHSKHESPKDIGFSHIEKIIK